MSLPALPTSQTLRNHGKLYSFLGNIKTFIEWKSLRRGHAEDSNDPACVCLQGFAEVVRLERCVSLSFWCLCCMVLLDIKNEIFFLFLLNLFGRRTLWMDGWGRLIFVFSSCVYVFVGNNRV